MKKLAISKGKKNQINKGNLNYVQHLKINEFFLFDSYNVLEKYKRGKFDDSDGIFVKYYNESEQTIVEDIYKIENFINSYEFFYIKPGNENPKIIGLLLPKNKLLNQNKTNLILNEIKNSKFIKEISYLLCLNLNKYNFDLKETSDDNIFILTMINNNNNNIIINNNYNNNNNNYNKEQNLLNEVNRLKTELEKYKKENENLKNNIVNLNKILESQKKDQINHTNNQDIKNLQEEIKDLKTQLNSKVNELNEIKLKIQKEELVNINDIMVINFISTDSSIHCGIKCLPTYTFAKIEEELYKFYDDLRNTDNEFIFNGRKIFRFKKIKDNNIHDGDIVQLIKIQ